MNTQTIIEVFLTAAALVQEPARVVAAQAVQDLYAAVKYYLRRKFADLPEAAKALEFANAKPHSPARRDALIEEAQPAELHRDPDLVALISRLEAAVLPSGARPRVSAHVTGRGNQVNVAGGDVIVTSRVVRRNAITPDDRHLAREQRTRLLEVIHELGARLGGADGEPNLGAVHAMLQRRFDVASYLLIPRERYAEALAFLQQQRAIHRGALRRRNPAAFRQDLFRAIYARASELGWSRERVYAFARERLELAQPIASLKQLGGGQLQALASKLRRAVPITATA